MNILTPEQNRLLENANIAIARRAQMKELEKKLVREGKIVINLNKK